MRLVARAYGWVVLGGLLLGAIFAGMHFMPMEALAQGLGAGGLKSGGTPVTGAAITPSSVTASGADSQFVCSATASVCELESDTNAATMTATVPGLDIGPSATPDANDRLACFSYGASGSKTRVACVDKEGDVSAASIVTTAAGASDAIHIKRGSFIDFSDEDSNQFHLSSNGSVFVANAGVRFAAQVQMDGTGNGFVADTASGSKAFSVSNDGAKTCFGSNASACATASGSTVTFAGPLIVTSTLSTSSGNINIEGATGVVNTSGYWQSLNAGTAVHVAGAGGTVYLAGAGSGVRLDNMALINTAPTVAACTSPSVTWENGTAAFQFDVGTGCATAAATVTLPTATNGWMCHCVNLVTTAQTVKQTGGTTTTAVVTSSANWVDGDDVRCMCLGG